MTVPGAQPTFTVRLVGLPVHTHAVLAQPAGRGKFEDALQPTVVGQQHQPGGATVQPPDQMQRVLVGIVDQVAEYLGQSHSEIKVAEVSTTKAE